MISEEKLEKAKKLLESGWSPSNTANHLDVKWPELERALKEKFPWVKSWHSKKHIEN